MCYYGSYLLGLASQQIHLLETQHCKLRFVNPAVQTYPKDFVLCYLHRLRCPGETALTKAALKGHDSIVRLLIEQRVDVNAADKKGNRVLVNAARNGHETTIRLLLEHRADVNAARLCIRPLDAENRSFACCWSSRLTSMQ